MIRSRDQYQPWTIALADVVGGYQRWPHLLFETPRTDICRAETKQASDLVILYKVPGGTWCIVFVEKFHSVDLY